MLTRRRFLKHMAAGTAAISVAGRSFTDTRADRPNFVFILSDDVGYGDLGCYGATKVRTPNIDRLAKEGNRFTDAHSTAAVCTPTRYSVLTGEYAWRNPDGDHILSGVAPLSIDPTRPTVASVLQGAGYATGLVGKWHLGLGSKNQPVDYNREIRPGPLDVGFDYAFFYPATNDRVPCVYVENRRVAGLNPADPIRVSYEKKVGDDPTGIEHPELLKMKADRQHSNTIVNGISRIGYMSGGQAARWVDEDMADVFSRRAVAFIEEHRERPFFLFFSPHSIHEPMAPHPRFKGTSDCGTRGDALHELDWIAGEILDALDRLGLAENTLVVFTSDNGGALKDTYDDGTNALHGSQPPNGCLRGEKGALYEGGHRVPFLARWPKRIPPGATSNQLLGLVDTLATLAAAAQCPRPKNAGPDSVDLLPAMIGETKPLRDHLVLQSNGARPLALRQGPWKLVSKRKAGAAAELYNLDEDLAEAHDLASAQPDRVREMQTLLERIRQEK